MTLIHVQLRHPSPTGLVGARGTLQWKPSTRLVDPPIITLPSPFNAPLGADLLDEDGEVVTPGVEGDAWIEVEPTGPEWAWLVTERVDGADRTRWFSVPDVSMVEYTSLIEVDPDTLDPAEEPPQPAWDAALSNEITAREEADDDLAADITAEAAARAAADTTLTTAVSSEAATRAAADTTLTTAVSSEAATRAAADTAEASARAAAVTSEANTRAAADTALSGDIATEASTRATADNLRLLKSANLSDVANAATSRTNLGLGTAATHAHADYATAGQGSAADSAVQPGDLADVATSGDYNDLINTPAGVDPVNLIEGPNIDISGTYPDLTISGTDAPVQSVNTQTGDVDLDADDISDTGTTHKFVTAGDVTKLGNLSGTNTGDQDLSGLVPNTRTVNGHPLSSNVTVSKTDVGLGSVDNTQQQPIDSDLTAIAAIAPSNDDVIQRKAGAWTNRTPAQLKTDLSLAKGDVGLGNVDNTSDANKPVSTAQAAADAAVAAAAQPLDSDLTAVAGLSPTNDDVIQRKSGAWTNRTPAQLKTDLALVKGDVGLGNVDNTSDANKPVSSAQQTALDGKQPLDSDLTTIAGLTATTDNMIQSVGSAWASRTPAQVKAALAITESDVSGLVTDLSNKQPLDSDLTTIAGLTATTDNFMVAASSAWASRTPTQAKTALALVKGDVGLGNVDNTSDATKDAATSTLTNKRITKRVFSTADTATLTIDSDSYDAAKVTALAQAMTIAAPTGTPTAMQPLIIRIKDNGTARALTWNAAFRAVGVTLPTTTVISKTVYVGCIRNTDDSTWDAIAVSQQA